MEPTVPAPGNSGAPNPGRVATRPARPAKSAWRLVVERRNVPLPDAPFVIGSNPDSGLQLRHHSVVGRHAALKPAVDGDSVLLRALPGGKVSVDSKPVGGTQPVQLKGGEHVQIGDIELRVERQDPAYLKLYLYLDDHRTTREYLRDELKKAPWMLISVGFHVILFLIFYRHVPYPSEEETIDVVFTVRPEVRDRRIDVEPALSGTAEDGGLQAPEAAVDPAPDVPEIDDPTAVEPDAPVVDDELPTLDEPPPGPNVLGVGGSGGGLASSGLGGRSSRLARGGGISLDKLDRGLADALRGFRDGGLDLVVLIDTTESMGPLIVEAKNAVDRIITNLALLVPDLRIGMIAYRDRDDAYLTKRQDLCDDRYRILNFLETLEASGGGDIPEAVYEATKAALSDASWRPGAYRVVLIVGDAPPHREDVSKLELLLRNAVNAGVGKTFVSTICVSRTDPSTSQEEVSRARKAFAEIARVGGGEFTDLGRLSDVGDELVTAVLGKKHKKAIQEALQRAQRDPRDRIIEDKIRAGDVLALLKQFNKGRTDPSLIEGLIRVRSGPVAQRCLSLLHNENSSLELREAALYILRRTVDYSGTFQVNRPVNSQSAEYERLKEAVQRAFADEVDSAEDGKRLRPNGRRDRR